MNPFSVNFAIPAEKIEINSMAQYDAKMESIVIKKNNQYQKLYINNSRVDLMTGSMVTATQTDPTSDESTDR